MNILIILHSHECGGAEKHALSLMQGLKAEGYQPAFAGPLDSWLGNHLQALGIPCFHVPMHGFFDPYSLYLILQAAKAIQADILHGHMARGSHYAGWASKLTGIPSIATAHATNSHKHFHRVGRIIAVSSAVREFLQSKGYPAESIEVVHSGVAMPDSAGVDRQAVRSRLGLSGGQIGLCMVARFIPDKGQDLAIKAVARQGRADLRLFLIGKAEGAWFAHIQSQIAAAGLERQVVCLGQREDVAELLVGMDIFLAPSRREALSLSILEACAVQLPIVAARVGGIPEIITDGENGLLVASDDAEALGQALRRLIAHPEQREALGRRAQSTFLRRFEMGRMIQSTLRVYRAVRPVQAIGSVV